MSPSRTTTGGIGVVRLEPIPAAGWVLLASVGLAGCGALLGFGNIAYETTPQDAGVANEGVDGGDTNTTADVVAADTGASNLPTSAARCTTRSLGCRTART